MESRTGDRRVFTLGEGLFLKVNTVIRVSEIDLSKQMTIKHVFVSWKNKLVNGVIYSAGMFIQVRVSFIQSIIKYLQHKIEIFV